MGNNGRYSLDWQDYQERLRRDRRKGSLSGRIPLLGLYAAIGFLILALVFFSGLWIIGYWEETGNSAQRWPKSADSIPQKMSEKDIPALLKGLDLDSPGPKNPFVLERNGGRLKIESSLDPGLQDYIAGLLARSKTLKAAVVALRPDDGEILAMVNYDNGGEGEELCLKADFPAASLFKIVSAAAALESAGFTPDRPVYFNGPKYTLYKSQLKRRNGKFATKTSFKRAFASSINSVFGKIGIYHLGQEVIADSADRFFFNRTIPFDLPVGESTIRVPEDKFGLAEIACGFNKRTVISPLHAALLASAVANNGTLMRPWLVKRILNDKGQVLYQARPTVLGSPMSRRTAKGLRVLMRETIIRGTCRRSFLRVRRKESFRDVEFGAKTGSINDETGQFKYDWLAAYALPENRDKAICLAVLGVHGERLGIRANVLGRYIINYYLTS